MDERRARGQTDRQHQHGPHAPAKPDGTDHYHSRDAGDGLLEMSAPMPPGGATVPSACASVADARPNDPVPGLEAFTAIPYPAPRFVECGAGYAQQSHEKHSIVELVSCGPHAGEAAKLEMDTLRDTGLNRSTAHQSRA